MWDLCCILHALITESWILRSFGGGFRFGFGAYGVLGVWGLGVNVSLGFRV